MNYLFQKELLKGATQESSKDFKKRKQLMREKEKKQIKEARDAKEKYLRQKQDET